MIVAQQKPLDKIQEMIAGYQRILILGCGTCVTVCFAGGERQVEILASLLRMGAKTGKNQTFAEHTVQRQCEWDFLDEIAGMLTDVDAVLSLGCGIGVQALVERFPGLAVFPGLNTSFLGLAEEVGIWSERCAACGDCILDTTGGICPIARCAKGLLNGPCGGSVGGKCELSPDLACAWQLIWDRLSALGATERYKRIQQVKDWSTSLSGGPRRIAREDIK